MQTTGERDAGRDVSVGEWVIDRFVLLFSDGGIEGDLDSCKSIAIIAQDKTKYQKREAEIFHDGRNGRHSDEQTRTLMNKGLEHLREVRKNFWRKCRNKTANGGRDVARV